MTKRLLSMLLTCFMIVLNIGVSDILAGTDSILAPSSRINESISTLSVKNSLSILEYALYIYRLDAIDRLKQNVIIDKCLNRSMATINFTFDLERMGVKRKGWTRYYPVMIGQEFYIVRIFLTKERAYQSPMAPELEVKISNPPVTCQIISGVNGILKDLPIAPESMDSNSPAHKSL